MRLAKRLIALLLACLMFGGVAAMAVDEPVQDYAFTEEELAKIYDPARYEAKDYLPGRLIVGLSKNIPADKTYAELFPDYTIDERYTKEYETITVCHFKLSENTQDAVTAAIGVLKNNPYVIYAEPYFVREEKRTLIGDKPVGAPEGATFTPSPEELAEIYDPANYTQREYAPGVVRVYFNRAVSGVRTYEELFPELEIDKIEYVFNCDKFTSLSINLKEKTKEAVVQAINILKDRADIAYAEPSYQSGFFMKNVVAGDIDQNGAIENPDLILMARYVVNLVELSAIEEYFADINGDGSVTNADIIQVARTIVGLTPFYKPMLSEQRAWELDSAMINKGYGGIGRMEYYGKYSGCDVAYIKGYGSVLDAYMYYDVAGHTFTFGVSTDGIYVFKGQDVLRLDGAYEAGWITASDVDRLCLSLEGPGPELTERVKSTVLTDFRKYIKTRPEISGTIKRLNYYGAVGGCDIVVIRNGGDDTPAIYHIQVGAYDFSFGSAAVSMYVFKDRACLRIDEAYEEGWLTDEDVAAIWAMGKPYTFSTGDDLAESAAFNIL